MVTFPKPDPYYCPCVLDQTAPVFYNKALKDFMREPYCTFGFILFPDPGTSVSKTSRKEENIKTTIWLWLRRFFSPLSGNRKLRGATYKMKIISTLM